MTETVVCNNELKKLIIENESRDCCVMIWDIIWVTILIRVWKSIMRYIDRGEADWFENRMMLKL